MKRGGIIKITPKQIKLKSNYTIILEHEFNIIALEENNLEEIPGSVYINGYIKLYCNYLMLPYSEIEYAAQDGAANNIVEPIFRNVTSRNRVFVAILLILTLACMSWYYLSREVRNRSILLMEHLENIEPKNYLANSINVPITNLVLQDNNLNDGRHVGVTDFINSEKKN